MHALRDFVPLRAGYISTFIYLQAPQLLQSNCPLPSVCTAEKSVWHSFPSLLSVTNNLTLLRINNMTTTTTVDGGVARKLSRNVIYFAVGSDATGAADNHTNRMSRSFTA